MTIVTPSFGGAGTHPEAVACVDCGDELRAGDDVRCRWCDDNRARHPEDYALVAVELPEAVAS